MYTIFIMKKLFTTSLSIFLAVCLFLTNFAQVGSLALAQENTDIPGVTQDMKTPDYWISKMPSPDKVRMNTEQITQYNKDTLAKLSAEGTMFDLPAMQNYSEEQIKGMIPEASAPTDELYDKDGNLILDNETFFADAVNNADVQATRFYLVFVSSAQT